MKSILILNYEFPPLGGGAAPASYEIAKGYVKNGHMVDVVTMGYKRLPKEEKTDGVNIFRVRAFRSKKEMCGIFEMFTYDISAMIFLYRRLKKVEYDFCHTHFIIPTGLVAYFAKKMFGLKYVVTAHGSDVPRYNEDRFKFAHIFSRPLLRIICNNAEKIISPSMYLKNLIKKNVYDYGDEKLTVIPNGINPQKFIPLEKKKIILSTGRLLPRKGFQYLIVAVSEIDVGYEVHIAGDGPMLAKLRQMAEKSKTKIVFHGWIDSSDDEYKELLGNADLYCLLSSKENASISLLEAMSAGCAVITTNVSGCPETVGETGLLVEPGNVLEIKNAILDLVTDKEKKGLLQKRARERVASKFDWDIIASAYQKILS